MKVVIFPNFQKENALKCSREACEILYRFGVEIYIDSKYRSFFEDMAFIKYSAFSEAVKFADTAIAVGGDGTILKCAKYLVGLDTKLLGINTGRLGFMASLESDRLDELERLISGEYSVSERMMLETEICSVNKSFSATALNDIVVSRIYSKISDFEIYADEELIGKYRADGAVFSTPTGSTAYSLSAGGPIIEPDLECIEMNLLCPHSLFTRPVLFSPEREIRFSHSVEASAEVYISIDGGEPMVLDKEECLRIKKSEHKIHLIDMNGNKFYDSLNKKLMKSIKGD